jgi:hypothetical protein
MSINKEKILMEDKYAIRRAIERASRDRTKKLVKEIFASFTKKHAFKFRGASSLIKVNQNVLQIIGIGNGSYGPLCDVSIQPIYIPTIGLNAEFGNRLNRLNTMQDSWHYGESEEEDRNNFLQMLELTESNVLPFFEEAGNPEGIIAFIEAGKAKVPMIPGFSPYSRHRHVGYSYLYLNEVGLAEEAFKKMAIELQDGYEVNFANKLIASALELVALGKESPEKLKENLSEIVRQNYIDLKLKV